jgi:hypothetical protein
MAVIGNGGVLEITREIPDAVALTSARINTGFTPSISLNNQAYWAGDQVIIAASDGVPFDVNGDGYADAPDAHGFYTGSVWDLGPSRDTLGTSAYQAGGDAGDFYNTSATTGLATQIDGYISRDALDRIRLWTDESAGHSESGTEEALLNVKPGNFIIAYYSIDSNYTTALDSAATTLQAITLPSSEQRLASVITLPSGFDSVCDQVNRSWETQCDLQEWVMSIDASNLDTTAIGETFGESVKSLVRGAGSLEFLAEHSYVQGQQDSLALLRLVLLTQNQCNTKARFYLYKNRTGYMQRIGGSVYYECDIMLTNTRLNTRATDIIAGTADFVAISDIRLKTASELIEFGPA